MQPTRSSAEMSLSTYAFAPALTQAFARKQNRRLAVHGGDAHGSGHGDLLDRRLERHALFRRHFAVAPRGTVVRHHAIAGNRRGFGVIRDDFRPSRERRVERGATGRCDEERDPVLHSGEERGGFRRGKIGTRRRQKRSFGVGGKVGHRPAPLPRLVTERGEARDDLVADLDPRGLFVRRNALPRAESFDTRIPTTAPRTTIARSTGHRPRRRAASAARCSSGVRTDPTPRSCVEALRPPASSGPRSRASAGPPFRSRASRGARAPRPGEPRSAPHRA